MTSAEQLILRGLHLTLRATFAPNDPEKSAQHFMRLQNDIGPWFADYSVEMAKPVVDFTLTPFTTPGDQGGGGIQQ